jgi:MFS transporter, FSR family, fosmidomycin resistance protein
VLDELVFGALQAAWPLIRRDLGLTYVEIGVLLTVPGFVSAMVEPVLGIMGDTGRRRSIVVVSGAAFGLSVAALAMAQTYPTAILAMSLAYPASGGFVALSQATLMDLAPAEHDRSMARWTAAGAVGAMAGPLMLSAAVRVGFGWRMVLAVLAVASLPLAAASRRIPQSTAHEGRSFRATLREAVRALRRAAVLRWLILLQVTDLMGDVLFGFLALYFVDVVHVSPALAGLAVFAWTAAGLAGDLWLVGALSRMDGVRLLRRSALATAILYVAFLLVGGFWIKLALAAVLGFLRAGWYAIPQGRLYAELADRTGTALALTNVFDVAARFVPIAIGAMAERFGLGTAMWILLLAPMGLLVGLPARTTGRAGDIR